MYDILINFGYSQGLTIEHKGSLASLSFDLYRPIRQQCYGLILGDSATVSEQCDENTQSVASSRFELKKRPVDFVILQESKREKDRWKTFVKCLGVTFNDTLAKELPSHYLGLCCVLNYLWHSPLIDMKEYELNAFVAQAVSQYSSDVSSLQRILVSVVNVRAVTLANVFMRGVEVLFQVSAVTSLSIPSLMPYNYFDGKLFSFYYYLSEQGSQPEELCDKIPERLEMFNFLKMMIQSEQLSLDADSSSEAGDSICINPHLPMTNLVDSTYGGKDSDDDEEEEDIQKPITTDVDMALLTTSDTNGIQSNVDNDSQNSSSISRSDNGLGSMLNSIVPQYEAISDDDEAPADSRPINDEDLDESNLMNDDISGEHANEFTVNDINANNPCSEPITKTDLTCNISNTIETCEPAPLFPKTEALYDALSSDDEDRPSKRGHKNSEKENQRSLNIQVPVKQAEFSISMEDSFRNGFSSMENAGHVKKKHKTSEN